MSGWFQYDTPVERTDEPEPLHGYKVHATDGSLGQVSDFSDEPGASYLVVQTGKLFVGSKKVVIPAGSVTRIDHDDKAVHVNLTKDQIKNAPEFDEATYTRSDYREELARHYGG